MFKNNLILLSYSFLWLIFLYFYKRKNERFTLGYVLIALYFVLSLLSIIAFNSEYSTDYFGNKLTLFPLLYLFLMMFITFVPLTTLKEQKLLYISIPSKNFCKYLCIFFGLFSLLEILGELSDIQNGFSLLLSNSDDIADLYFDSTERRMSKRSFSGVFSIVGVISNLGSLIGPLIFYIYLLHNNRNKIVIFLASMTILQGFLHGVAVASRALIALRLFTVLLLFFFFMPFMERKLKKKIKRIFFLGAIISISLLTIITVARVNYSKQTSSYFNVTRYLGEGPIIFDNYCMDAHGTREGYHTATLFVYLLGKPILSESEKRFKFRDMTIDNSRFYTYVGDYVLDYGPETAFIIFIILSLLAFRSLRHKDGLCFSQVIIVYMVFRFCSSFHQASYTGIGGNIAFVFELMLAFFFLSPSVPEVKIYRKS